RADAGGHSMLLRPSVLDLLAPPRVPVVHVDGPAFDDLRAPRPDRGEALMKTYSVTARCQVCKEVLNTATGIPEDERTRIIMSAPLMAICKVKAHNTLSDCNIGVKLEWKEECD